MDDSTSLPVVFLLTDLGPGDEDAFVVQAVGYVEDHSTGRHQWASWAGERP